VLVLALRGLGPLRLCDAPLVVESVEDTEAERRVPDDLGEVLARGCWIEGRLMRISGWVRGGLGMRVNGGGDLRRWWWAALTLTPEVLADIGMACVATTGGGESGGWGLVGKKRFLLVNWARGG
jgi:hypothetical protein